MTPLKFICDGVRPDGERTYRLVIGGRTMQEHLTIDQVVEAINRYDEESLGERRGGGTK